MNVSNKFSTWFWETLGQPLQAKLCEDFLVAQMAEEVQWGKVVQGQWGICMLASKFWSQCDLLF